ncbi:3-phosphoshikimate 1-carboxyvinyltransferase, partial [Geobacillus thermoleovorans]|nr:3-phosphoshikimate 1-carboxyvinyltransferase [Geobacillus thermoleovorans]
MQLPTNVSSLRGTLEVPGDKSISHRAVMLGALASGRTVIDHFLPGADCLSTIDCFRKLGVDIRQDGTTVVVEGAGPGGLREPAAVLDVGNSGT